MMCKGLYTLAKDSDIDRRLTCGMHASIKEGMALVLIINISEVLDHSCGDQIYKCRSDLHMLTILMTSFVSLRNVWFCL
jgi:hypothetical protein